MRSALLIFFLVVCSFSAAAIAQTATPPCVMPVDDDGRTEMLIIQVLDAFPASADRPKFIGMFRDGGSKFELTLYSDSSGIFGQIASPVLDADSPTSRLYEPRLEGSNLFFEARVPSERMRFEGTMTSSSVKGIVKSYGTDEKVTLKKVKPEPKIDYVSRAQYDCAMKLWRRH